MPRKMKGAAELPAEAQAEISRWTCGKCGVNVREQGSSHGGPGVWRGAATVYHCDGHSFAFGARGELRERPHHYPAVNPPCWKCGAPMGCPRCSGPENELLCMNLRLHRGCGPMWANAESYSKHGPLDNHPQTAADYMGGGQ